MTLKSLARPVENLQSVDEAHVLAIVDHLAPMLEDWREGQDLRVAFTATEQDLAARKADFAARRTALEALTRQGKAAQERVNSLAIGGFSALVGGLLCLAIPKAGGLLALLLIGGGLAVGYFWNRARQDLDAIAKQSAALEATVADLDAQVAALTTRHATIEEELSGRSGSFPLLDLANLRFPLSLAEVSGRTLLLDQSGSFDEVTLKTIDVSGLEEGVSHIADRIERLATVPPMLSPSSASDAEDPIERLYGEEYELGQLVGDFSHSLGLLRDVELSLPIVPGTGGLAQRLKAVDLRPPATNACIIIYQETDEAANIADFVTEAERSREHGRQVFADLARAHDRLSSGCYLYASARQSSANALHKSWLEVLGRANWCDRRFYCARTIMSPQYLQDLLGCPVDQAYRVSQDDLLDLLSHDDSIRERLNAKPDLETQLRAALISVQEFMDRDNDDSARSVSRPRYIEDQYRECLSTFQRTLQKVMTGSTFPVLHFSREALLHYEPDSEEWRSELSPHVYRTHDVLRYGGVVKAYSDLMIPLWEHLWTEKADFRKAETFRTNDQLIRMSEKEAEKLIDVANQFRDDLRSVRENLNNLGADLKSKVAEITSFKDGMDDLGVLSPRAREMIEQSGAALGDEEDSLLTEADRLETILAAQPQAQMENRGTVQDPIELVRGFDALIVVDQAPHLRLLSA